MDSAHQFWDWFSKSNKAYSFIEQVDANLKEKLLLEFQRELHNYSRDLYFEIGGDPDDSNELIISAGGNRAYFKLVEHLVGLAPKIDKWEIFALIPPRGIDFESLYDGVRLVPKDMWFMPLESSSNPNILGLEVYVPGISIRDKSVLESAIRNILFNLLGEKSASEDIGYLSVEALLESPHKLGLIQLEDLPSYISWTKRRA